MRNGSEGLGPSLEKECHTEAHEVVGSGGVVEPDLQAAHPLRDEELRPQGPDRSRGRVALAAVIGRERVETNPGRRKRSMYYYINRYKNRCFRVVDDLIFIFG